MSSSDRLDAERHPATSPREVERVRGRLALGHEDAEHALRPEGPRAEEGDEARVDAAREPDDGAATPEVLVDDLAQALGDLVAVRPASSRRSDSAGQLLSRHRRSRRSSRRRSG